MPANKWAQLVQTYDGRTFTRSCLVQTKVDGVRARFTEEGAVTRNGTRLLSTNLIAEALAPMIKRYGVLDVELFVPYVGFNTASGIIRRESAPHPNKIYAAVLDLPEVGLPLVDRLSLVHEGAALCDHEQVIVPDYWYFPKGVSGAELKPLMETAVAKGAEGLVVKYTNSLYAGGQRPADWFRVVPQPTTEAIVIDATPGIGKYAMALGALVVQDETGAEYSVGTGFDDATRRELWRRFKAGSLTGQCCTVKYKDRQASGKARQPVFAGWRFDK